MLEVLAAGNGIIVQLQKSLFAQPAIDVHSALERGEAVIGHDQQGGIRQLSPYPADGFIHHAIGGQQIVVECAPQHVRVLIYAEKVEE